MTYKDAGVDKEKGYEHVQNIKQQLEQTHTKNVLNTIGGFAGLYELPKDIQNPVLVSGTDGIGTKVKLAAYFNKYDTIGIDCVAMCVNDILCHGATPLFFLDYLAVGSLDTFISSQIVQGVVEGCKQGAMALIGGETAEMPGVYHGNDFDMAGFAVGIVDKNKQIDGSEIKVNDIILGIPSSGFHSNGYSLIRHILNTDELLSEFSEELLTPTRIYVPEILKLLEKIRPHGMAHITGGGLIENLPRILPKSCHAKLNFDSLVIPETMLKLQALGNLSNEEMIGTFNMGVGFVLVVNPKDLENVQKIIPEAFIIGEIKKGQPGITV